MVTHPLDTAESRQYLWLPFQGFVVEHNFDGGRLCNPLESRVLLVWTRSAGFRADLLVKFTYRTSTGTSQRLKFTTRPPLGPSMEEVAAEAAARRGRGSARWGGRGRGSSTSENAAEGASSYGRGKGRGAPAGGRGQGRA
eukprot:1150783-Pelagomonas_calceolata.AAC.9